MKMKKKLLRKLNILFIVGIFISSCQDDLVNDLNTPSVYDKVTKYTPEQVTNAPYEEQKVYTKYHLGVLSQALLNVATNKDFQRILYSEIDKDELSESSVLLSTLFKRINLERPSLFNLMQENVSSLSFKASQKAFWGIEQDILYPQLYIPFYEEARLQNKNFNQRNVYHPVIAVDPIENQETVTGYIIDEQGQTQELEGIDEDYARESEVWIISLHESIKAKEDGFTNECENLPLLCYPDYKNTPSTKDIALRNAKTYGTCTNDGNTGNAREDTNGKGIDVYVDRVTIKTHKEPWHSGRSDVWLGFTSLWGGGFNEFDFTKDRDHYWDPIQTVGIGRDDQIYSRGTISSDLIKVRRRDVRNKKEIDMYDKQIEKWGEGRRKSAIAWVAFEMDSWPSPRITHTVNTRPNWFPYPLGPSFSGNSFTFSVRTRESTPYGSGYFNWYQGHEKYACGARENNNEIDISFITEKPFGCCGM
jgi:hypothetical protein